MKTIVNTTLAGIVAIFLVAFVLLVVNTSLDKSEVVSCLELQEQARVYGGFYLTSWQNEMCVAHQIEINAPVK
jgi:hypothetical protein